MNKINIVNEMFNNTKAIFFDKEAIYVESEHREFKVGTSMITGMRASFRTDEETICSCSINYYDYSDTIVYNFVKSIISDKEPIKEHIKEEFCFEDKDLLISKIIQLIDEARQ